MDRGDFSRLWLGTEKGLPFKLTLTTTMEKLADVLGYALRFNVGVKPVGSSQGTSRMV